MSNTPMIVRFTSLRTMLSRWGHPRATAKSRPANEATRGRRPGASTPVYVEVSPAKVDPFPEPRTIPDGWDMSELV